MDLHKGFSLIEVLISLMLITTIGLACLEQQQYTAQLLHQLELRANASQFLNDIEEVLFIDINANQWPALPSSYRFRLKQEKQNITLQLDWFTNLGSIIRKYDGIGHLK